jgi:VCBS repeat-containing protein
MFFYNGLFVAESQLNGDVTVSDTGEYAYTHSDDSIQVQNLTNKEIVISVDDKTFTIAPNATIIEELEPGEPVNH